MYLKLFFLLYLYILEGIPYGLQSRFLPLVLRSKGVSLTSLGFYKLLYVPWLFKSLYAPFVDRYFHKCAWLFLSLSGLFIVTVILSLCDELSPENLLPGSRSSLLTISICLAFYNFWASTQDIAVDALALGLLEANELSFGNTIQVVGYKLGATIGGGLLSSLVGYFSVSAILKALSCVYASGMCLCMTPVFWSLEYDRNKSKVPRCTKECGDSADTSQTNITQYNLHKEGLNFYADIFKTFIDSIGTRHLIYFLLIYKLGEQGSMNMLPLMLFDRGFSMAKVGLWTGIFGQFSSVVGSLSGHYFQTFFKSSLTTLFMLMLVRVVLQFPLIILSFDLIGELLPNFSFWIGCLLMNITLIVSGAITTVVFTLMMHCTRVECPKFGEATHYTVLSTAELLGKLMFAIIAAYITDQLGYGMANIIFLFLSILPIQFIHKFYDTLNFESKH